MERLAPSLALDDKDTVWSWLTRRVDSDPSRDFEDGGCTPWEQDPFRDHCRTVRICCELNGVVSCAKLLTFKVLFPGTSREPSSVGRSGA